MTKEQLEAQLERFADAFECERGDVIPAIGCQILGDPPTGSIAVALDMSAGDEKAFGVVAFSPDQMFEFMQIALMALQGTTMSFPNLNPVN